MTPSIAIILFLLLATSILVLGWPFVINTKAQTPGGAQKSNPQYEFEKDMLLESLQEAEFDYEMEKISKEDLELIKGSIAEEGALLMQKIEEWGKGKPAKRKMPVAQTIQQESKISNFCPSCGQANTAKGKFCPHCGAKLS